MESICEISDVFEIIVLKLDIEDLFALHCVSKRLYTTVNYGYRKKLERILRDGKNHYYHRETLSRLRKMLDENQNPKYDMV